MNFTLMARADVEERSLKEAFKERLLRELQETMNEIL